MVLTVYKVTATAVLYLTQNQVISEFKTKTQISDGAFSFQLQKNKRR